MHLVLYQNDVYFFRPQIYNYLCLIPSCHTTYLHYLILILPIAETSYYHNKHETPHKYNVVNNTLKNISRLRQCAAQINLCELIGNTIYLVRHMK